MHEILEEGRRRAALGIGQLWWSYVAIGGSARPTDVAGMLCPTPSNTTSSPRPSTTT